MINRRLSKILDASFEKRTSGDYENYHTFVREEVQNIEKKCRQFLSGVERALEELIGTF